MRVWKIASVMAICALSIALAGVSLPASAGMQATGTRQHKTVQATTNIHGYPATVTAASNEDLNSALSRISSTNSAEVQLLATNPCLGLHLLCLFQDANGGGPFIAGFTKGALFNTGFINLSAVPRGSGNWNNVMTSWGNDITTADSPAGGSPTMCWWVNNGGGGAGHLMRSLGATIQNVLPSENDTASSVDTQNSTCH